MHRFSSLAMLAALLVSGCRCPLTKSGATSGSKRNELSSEALEILQKTKEFELLSIDPVPMGEPTGEKLHGQHVMGRIVIKNGEIRKKLLSELKKGISKGNHSYDCFFPRHAIRANHAGKTLDLLICFECCIIKIWLADKISKPLFVSRSPRELFNKTLMDSNIPLPVSQKISNPPILKIKEYED